MASLTTPLRNRLLNAISATDLDLLRPDLEMVQLPVRLSLERPNQPVTHVYFPEGGFASVVAHTKGDRSIEVGLIGKEGMTGLSVVLGDDRSANETFIQSSGSGSRLPTAALRAALASSHTLRGCLLHYVQAFLCQTSQTALANGRANIEERLARWLLMAHDRLEQDRLELTHEFMALMLGVRRPGITVALHFLESKGLVKAVRGAITILDREGLLEIANGSYGVPEAEHQRLFGYDITPEPALTQAPAKLELLAS